MKRTLGLLLAAACLTGGLWQTMAQSPCQQEYAKNLFAIAWLDRQSHASEIRSSDFFHRFILYSWKPRTTQQAIGNNIHYVGTVVRRTVHFFDEKKEFVVTSNGFNSRAVFGEQKEESIIFYVKVAESDPPCFPDEALKVEIFPNRRIALITQAESGLRRMLPVQRFVGDKDDGWRYPQYFVKESLTAVNFGHLGDGTGKSSEPPTPPRTGEPASLLVRKKDLTLGGE